MLDLLPFEIQSNILCHLSIYDLKHVYLINKEMNDVCTKMYPDFQKMYLIYTRRSLNTCTLLNRLNSNIELPLCKKNFYKLMKEDQSKIHCDQNLTLEQKEIIGHPIVPGNILVVQAYAGTGKSTTLEHFCKTHTDKSILCMAFNTSVVKHLTHILKDSNHVTVQGFHKLAYRNDIDTADKLKPVLFNNFENFTLTEAIKKRFDQYCYSRRQSTDDVDVNFIFECMQDGRVPYVHDAYLKEYQLSYPTLNYDVILIDEAQDCNDCMADIVMRQTNAYKVFFGDIYQNINAFRNENNNDIIQDLYESNNHTKKFLSVSFRYGGTFGLIINEYLRSYLGSNKILNTVGTNDTNIQTFEYYTELPNHTTIVCRKNASTLKLMFHFLYNTDKTFRILKNKKIDFDEEIQINEDLYHLAAREVHNVKHPKLKRFDDDLDAYLFFKANNKYKWLLRFDISNSNPRDCWKLAKERYDQLNPDIIITNTHQSKGMEFDNVALCHDFQFGTEELKRIFYTAVTRVKKTLYLLHTMYKREFVKQHLFIE